MFFRQRLHKSQPLFFFVNEIAWNGRKIFLAITQTKKSSEIRTVRIAACDLCNRGLKCYHMFHICYLYDQRRCLSPVPYKYSCRCRSCPLTVKTYSIVTRHIYKYMYQSRNLQLLLLVANPNCSISSRFCSFHARSLITNCYQDMAT